MSPPKLFVHQRSSSSVIAESLASAMHTTEMSFSEIALSNTFD